MSEIHQNKLEEYSKNALDKRKDEAFNNLLWEYENFKKKRPKYHLWGMIGIFGVPIFLVIIMLMSGQPKMFFLSFWILSILISAGGLIHVEYKFDRLRSLLGIVGADDDFSKTDSGKKREVSEEEKIYRSDLAEIKEKFKERVWEYRVKIDLEADLEAQKNSKEHKKDGAKG